MHTEPSDMSFSVSLSGRSFEWGSNGLSGLFAQPSNLLSPAFHSMLTDMARFNAEVPAFLASVQAEGEGGASAALTMRQFLDAGRYGDPFRKYYLLPQVAAVWSASGASALDFPARTLCQFFVNHSLLQPLDRPVWRTVARRSREYVRRLAGSLPPATTTIRLACPVTGVRRTTEAGGATSVHVTDASGSCEAFDAVVFGAHPDTVLGMLGEDASAEERAALSAFHYASNTAYLHTDADFMPRARSAWSSWNYLGKGSGASGAGASPSGADAEPCCVTYWLNRLQNLPESLGVELFVTLNPDPAHTPHPSKTLQQLSYSHPQYTLQACAGQAALARLQGVRGLHYAGAYLGYGFHEDGLTSGVRAAMQVTGVAPPWWGVPLYSVPPGHSASGSASSSSASLPLPGGQGSLTVEDAALCKASGGPYWVDNLGNGGVVGKATRAVGALVAALPTPTPHPLSAAPATGPPPPPAPRAVAQPSLLAALTTGVLGAAALQAAHFALRHWPKRLPATGLLSAPWLQAASGRVRELAGATPRWPSLPLALGGLAAITAASWLAARSGAAGQAAAAAEAAAAVEKEGVRLIMEVNAARAHLCSTGSASASGSSTSTSTSTSTSSTGGGAVASSIEAKAAATLPLPEDLWAVCTSSSSTGYLLVDTPDDVLHAHAALVSPSNSSSSSSAAATLLTPALSGKACRAYKSALVARSAVKAALTRSGIPGTAAAAAAAAAASPRSSVFSVPVSAYMRQFGGGYTGAPPPLQSPALLPRRSPVLSLAHALYSAARALAISPVLSFLSTSIRTGCIVLRLPDGSEAVYGNPSAPRHQRARLVVYSWGFFTRVATESDLGLARSFMTGEWGAEDLTVLFNVFIANRDTSTLSTYGIWTAWLGLAVNYARFAVVMDNSVQNSRSNIHAHYDLSNDLFVSFLDPGTMMYSCGFFDTRRRELKEVDLPRVGCSPGPASSSSSSSSASASASATPTPTSSAPRLSLEESERAVLNSYAPSAPGGAPVEVVYGGTLEEAQLRKLDHLIARARVSRHHKVLDLGFGWGGLSIRLAETIGCQVTGITLSQEQHDLALERVRARGLEHLITFEIVDYRVFAAANPGRFDRIISIEMIEAVGNNYFPSFMASLDRLLAPNGVIALQAITMPETRYAEYLATTDFINTVIFPGGCCPSLAALTDAMMKHSTLILNSVDQFNLHYGETLRRWRANFNAALDSVIRPLGFDDVFIRTWNYYLCYCGE